jgi:hypothetical protein
MNDERQRIILYGDSLILAGVQASLGASPHLEIIPLDQPLACLAKGLLDLQPDAIIFDLGSVSPDFPLALLQQANLVLIGIDPENHQALAWSGQRAAAVEAADLIEIIHSKKGTRK